MEERILSPEQMELTAQAGAPSFWRRLGYALAHPNVTLLSRVILGVVFLISGVSKVGDPRAFAANISAYKMVPEGIVQPMALGVPWLEAMLGLYLLIGLFLRWSALATGALLIVFIIALGSAMSRGLRLDCGCFGNVLGTSLLRDQVGWLSFVRDGVLLGLAAHLFFVPSRYSLDTLLRRGREAEEEEPE
jgi:uncharacterized membrane protein YphA (DoxX/SURF4 family)